MSLFRCVIALLILAQLAACSTTVTGPITGREYNFDIGCTDNMQAYERDREEVVGKKADDTPAEVKLDCPASPEPQP
ncbi:MAG: hypothetical protein QG652_1679 [Pseudomonadota bacterium]|nr:hypothetical protein [Pseudomonadota bacterium]